jgi:hypothetical protein
MVGGDLSPQIALQGYAIEKRYLRSVNIFQVYAFAEESLAKRWIEVVETLDALDGLVVAVGVFDSIDDRAGAGFPG